MTDGEVNLATVVMHRGEVARLLARVVGRGEYALRPAEVRSIVVEGKRRVVFGYPLLDLVVQGVVADVLAEAVEPRLSDNLYSYRPGRSWMDGVAAFARYVRAHRRERRDPRTRGLYVLRRDVEAYTDSIPLGAGSPIWQMLDEAIAARGEPGPTAADRALIENVVRPTVLSGADGTLATRIRGVATGQPIACLCFNLFLRDVDRDLDAVAGGFYARYSDDLLFAHPDVNVARDASARVNERIDLLGLRFNADKRRDLYLTGAGRDAAEWPEARGTTSVSFLGMRVTLDGTVALGHRKTRGLLRDARRRATNAARSLDGSADEARRGRAVAGVLKTLLDDDDPHLGGAAAPLLARAITDRRQLDELDHELARIVASAVTHTPGPRAFRKVSYRRVRSEFGLSSLRRARDNGAAARSRTAR